RALFRAPRGVRADVAEGAVAAGHVRRPRSELPAADEGGDAADAGLGAGGLVEGRPLPGGQARLQEAKLDPVRKAAGRLDVGRGVDVELQALVRPLLGPLRVVDV